MVRDSAMDLDAWLDAELHRIAPHLADVPERVNRFLANVQRMLVAPELEARRYAAEVAREAEEIAVLRAEWAHTRARFAERAAPPVTCLTCTCKMEWDAIGRPLGVVTRKECEVHGLPEHRHPLLRTERA